MNTSRSITKYLIIAMLSLGSTLGFAQVSFSVNIAPPPLVVETQPDCPGDGYIWTPGYYAYDNDGGYYWVAGAWTQPPQVGVYWTPGYWGYNGGSYVFNAGYWGPTVGFYGGVNYGFGYTGHGYGGGRWQDGHFAYNTAVNHVNTTIVHNTYVDKTVIVNNNNRVSYNGGNGIHAEPTEKERQAASENHVQATAEQQARVQAAAQNRTQHAPENGNGNATAANPPPKENNPQASPNEQKPDAQNRTAQDKPEAPKPEAPKPEAPKPEAPQVAHTPAEAPHDTHVDEPAKPNGEQASTHTEAPKPEAPKPEVHVPPAQHPTATAEHTAPAPDKKPAADQQKP